MGPGPNGPGKPQSTCTHGSCPARFNGAGAEWPRKTGVYDAKIAEVKELQWGRGRMAPENAVFLKNFA